MPQIRVVLLFLFFLLLTPTTADAHDPREYYRQFVIVCHTQAQISVLLHELKQRGPAGLHNAAHMYYARKTADGRSACFQRKTVRPETVSAPIPVTLTRRQTGEVLAKLLVYELTFKARGDSSFYALSSQRLFGTTPVAREHPLLSYQLYE